MRALEELGGFLGPLGFQHYIPSLFYSGIDTLRALRSCTGAELMAAGIPLGEAKQVGIFRPTILPREPRRGAGRRCASTPAGDVNSKSPKR